MPHPRLLHFAELFRGTIDGASVHPREIVKQALVDIRLLDHIVVGDGVAVSLAERGLV